MGVSSPPLPADGAGGVAGPRAAAGRVRRWLAAAVHRGPAAAEDGARGRPAAGAGGPRPDGRGHGARYARLGDDRRGSRCGRGLSAGARDRRGVHRARAGVDLGHEAVALLWRAGPAAAGPGGHRAGRRAGGRGDSGGDRQGGGGRWRAVNGCGSLTLRQSAEVILRAAVLVTNDSAPLHFAQAVGTVTVAIFGPTVPAFGFGPRGPRD